MATVTVNEQSLYDTADAIRTKLGVETTYYPSEFASAIASITGGTELSASDEGKVVVEDDGSYVLQSQTSQTITSNGTYDTTTNNEVVVSVAGGGGSSTNILSGAEMPTAQDGTNGAIFLLMSSANTYVSDFPADKLSLSEWNKSDATFTKFDNSYNPTLSENTLDHTGGTGYERVYVSVPVETNTDYIFELDYYSPSGVSSGYSGQINMAASVDSNISQSSGGVSKIAYTNLSTVAQSVYSHYTTQFNSGSNSSVYLVIDLNIRDGNNCVLKFKNFSFHKVGDTPQIVHHEVVIKALLKVGGAWVPLEGQEIEDVNVAGGGSTNIISGVLMPSPSEGDNGDVYIQYGIEDHGLPSGYEPIVAVITNGTNQAIDTGYIPNAATTIVEFTGVVYSYRNSSGTFLYGTRSGITFESTTSGESGGYITNRRNTNPSYESLPQGFYENRVKITYGTDALTIESLDNKFTDTTYASTSGSGTASNSMYLFALRGYNNTFGQFECERFRILEGTTAMMDLVAAKRSSDDAIGMYDLIGDSFYVSIGVTPFTAKTRGSDEIAAVYLKVNGSWVDIKGQDVDDVNTEGGSSAQQRPRYVHVFDDPTNASVSLYNPTSSVIYPAQVQTQQYSYVFLFADNQTTNITIGGVTHSSSDIQIGSSWNTDNVYAFAGEAQNFDISLKKGDSGNHVCTIIAVEGTFATKYTQTMFNVATASQTISAALDEAYVLLLFCVYNGGGTASITFMGESVTVDRYANRHSNSIYCYATKLTNLAANDVVSVSIDATASNVIGIMGIFGDAND